jgi:hypothetical protein
MLDQLFARSDIGTALWSARRHFIDFDNRNPLGLAYTLYGRATARLGQAPIIALERDAITQHVGKHTLM